MKTVFEGKVNDQVFDNVAEYNDALVKALNEGNCVNASSRTYSVEEPEQPVQDLEREPQSFFYGNVNGEEFDDVTNYNEAIQRALDAGEDVNAYTETRTGKFAEETMVEEECEEDFDWFPGMDEEEYYMDSTVSDDESAKVIYSDWENYLGKNLDAFKNEVLQNMSKNDLIEFYNDICNVIDKVKEDYKITDKMLAKKRDEYESLLRHKQSLEAELKEFNMNLSAAAEKAITEKEMNIRNDIDLFCNCLKLNELFKKYYDSIEMIVRPLANETSVESERKANIRRLIQEIFPEWK